jgi:hypothetical protein
MEGSGSGLGSGAGAVRIKIKDPCADPAGPKTYGSRSGSDPEPEYWRKGNLFCTPVHSLSVLPGVPKRAVPRRGAALAGLGNRKAALGTVQVRIPAKKDFIGEINKTNLSVMIFGTFTPANYKLEKL